MTGDHRMQDQRRKLLARIAYLYYIQDQTQSEIAKDLSIHRSSVSRMLKQAKEEGVVKFEIENYDPEIFELELYLKEKFDLKEVLLCSPPLHASNEEKDDALANAVASFLKRIIKKNDIVGVSWGSTLRKITGRFGNPKMAEATFVPLVGGPSHVNSAYHVNTIVYDFARHFNGQSVFINAAAVQETKELRDGIMNSKYFRQIHEYWAQLDIALVGIGGPLSSRTAVWRDLLTEEDLEDLKLREAIGDCCCQFFDRDGKILKGDLYNRTISVSLEKLQDTPYAIAMARGKQKTRSILAMLKKKYINVLISDYETAIEILRAAKDPVWKNYLQ